MLELKIPEKVRRWMRRICKRYDRVSSVELERYYWKLRAQGLNKRDIRKRWAKEYPNA